MLQESKSLIDSVNSLINNIARNPDIPLYLITDVLKSISNLEKAIDSQLIQHKGE